MTFSHHTRVLTLAAGAAFLALLDVTVVNLAIPALGRAYPATSVTTLSWVITAYATLFAALLAPAGRLADVISRRSLYRVGVGGFAALSLICAVSPSVPVLLVARALQGAFAATMIPASLAILLADTPPERRGNSVALWSATGAFAAAVGPSVGGVLVHAFGWRSLFVINVPTGLVLAAAAGILPRTATARTRLPDALGTVLLAAGIGLAALGLSQGSVWGWGDARTIASLAGGVAGTVAAIQRSWRMPVPAIETGLWKHRTFALANGASLLYGASLYAWMLLGVLVLTELWHYSELQAGLAMTPGAIAASVAAVVVGRRATPRTAVAVGAVLMAASGLFIAATLPDHGEFLTYWLPIGLVLGAGMGMVTTGTSTAAALSVPPQSFAAGTGLNQTARQVGGALGVATLATILRSGAAGQTATFAHVYVFVSLAALGAGLVGLALVLRPAASPASAAADEPVTAPVSPAPAG
jgi:EmrB/QacA subfamily drug resistance transporter